VFWRIGDEKFISPRWKDSTGTAAFFVLIILGGWAGGISLIIQAIVALLT
jgi:hypothetical protein